MFKPSCFVERASSTTSLALQEEDELPEDEGHGTLLRIML